MPRQSGGTSRSKGWSNAKKRTSDKKRKVCRRV